MQRVIARKRRAGHQDFLRPRDTDELHESLHVLEVHDHAQPGRGNAQPRVRRGDAKVAHRRQLQTASQGGSLNPSDRWETVIPQGLEHALERREEVDSLGARDGGEVRSRTEHGSRSRENDDARRIVASRLVESHDDCVAQLEGQRVARLGPIELDREHGPGAGGRDQAHSITAMASPSWTTPPSVTFNSEMVPEAVASTGISIFIDSRMQIVSPSPTSSPLVTTTFETLATISASTSSLTWPPVRKGRAVGLRPQREQRSCLCPSSLSLTSRLHNAMRPGLRAGGDGVYAARRYECERSRPPAGNPSAAGAPRPDNTSCALPHDHQTPDHGADDRGDEGPADD